MFFRRLQWSSQCSVFIIWNFCIRSKNFIWRNIYIVAADVLPHDNHQIEYELLLRIGFCRCNNDDSDASTIERIQCFIPTEKSNIKSVNNQSVAHSPRFLACSSENANPFYIKSILSFYFWIIPLTNIVKACNTNIWTYCRLKMVFF